MKSAQHKREAQPLRSAGGDAQNMKARLKETIDHLRADIDEVDEPQVKAIFETSARRSAG
jgi:hypothetical protein